MRRIKTGESARTIIGVDGKRKDIMQATVEDLKAHVKFLEGRLARSLRRARRHRLRK